MSQSLASGAPASALVPNSNFLQGKLDSVSFSSVYLPVNGSKASGDEPSRLCAQRRYVLCP